MKYIINKKLVEIKKDEYYIYFNDSKVNIKDLYYLIFPASYDGGVVIDNDSNFEFLLKYRFAIVSKIEEEGEIYYVIAADINFNILKNIYEELCDEN